MKVVYSEAHEAYSPGSTVYNGRPTPAREVPERMTIIRKALERSRVVRLVEPKRHGDRVLARLHRPDYVAYLRDISAATPLGQDAFPTIWPPIKVSESLPAHMGLRMGYYVGDTGTPVTRAAYASAVAAVDCALTGAEMVIAGERLVYALVRPPGHHAERARAGGLCFFNNTAFAALTLSHRGRVAVLDIDYHHGNGTQSMFYRSNRVLTTSIHGERAIIYSGHASETGAGRGKGYNLNVPMPKQTSTEQYRAGLGKVLARIRRHRPDYLVVALGFDTYEKDPNGGFIGFSVDSFTPLGHDVASLGIPTLLVQEGGYNLDALGACAANFFAGIRGG